jgi:hypothetical protein
VSNITLHTQGQVPDIKLEDSFRIERIGGNRWRARRMFTAHNIELHHSRESATDRSVLQRLRPEAPPNRSVEQLPQVLL